MGFEPRTSLSLTRSTAHSAIMPFLLLCWIQIYFRSESNRDHSKMKNESVKKSVEKSKNVLEEKRKIVKRKFCIKKTNTFIIIAMNFVQEQLIRIYYLLQLKKKRIPHETPESGVGSPV